MPTLKSSKPTIERFVSEFQSKLMWHKTFINTKGLEYNTSKNAQLKIN